MMNSGSQTSCSRFMCGQATSPPSLRWCGDQSVSRLNPPGDSAGLWASKLSHNRSVGLDTDRSPHLMKAGAMFKKKACSAFFWKEKYLSDLPVVSS